MAQPAANRSRARVSRVRYAVPRRMLVAQSRMDTGKTSFGRRVMTEIEQNLHDPTWFAGLETVSSHGEIRKTKIGDRFVVIKNTGGMAEEGFDYARLRHALAFFQAAVRSGRIKPNGYRVRSIPIYGRVGKYVVMAFIEDIGLHPKSDGTNRFSAADVQSEGAAYQRFVKDIAQAVGKRGQIPQLFHCVVQNTKPASPREGTWIFYPPYDIK